MAESTPICEDCSRSTSGYCWKHSASFGGGVMTMRSPCGAAAPLVANGGGYVGCQLVQGHDGEHSITIKWGR